MTGRAFCSLACEAMRAPALDQRHAAGDDPAAGVFSPLIRRLGETSYQFTALFVIDASRFQQALGPSTRRPTERP